MTTLYHEKRREDATHRYESISISISIVFCCFCEHIFLTSG